MFDGLVDKLIEEFDDRLCDEIAELHMPLESDEEDKRFEIEYKQAIKYAIIKLKSKITK